MTKAMLFWMLYILAILFTGYFRVQNFHGDYAVVGMSLMEFILIGLLGWQVFGGAVKG